MFALVHKYRPISLVSIIVNKLFFHAVPPFSQVIEKYTRGTDKGKRGTGEMDGGNHWTIPGGNHPPPPNGG